VRFAQRRKAATDPTVELPRDDHHDDQS